MDGPMEKVKKLIDLGLAIPVAIREALGVTLGDFATRNEIPATTMSETINGARRPTERIIAALIAELGGTEDEWRMLLWEAGRPEPSSTSTT